MPAKSPRFATCLSTSTNSETAREECLEGLRFGLDGASPDLVVVFSTHHHGAILDDLARDLRQATEAEVILGCTGVNIIGGSREVEGESGLVLWGASLPGTTLRPFEVTAEPGPEGEPVFTGGPDDSPAGPPDPARLAAGESSVILLADPYSFPPEQFLDDLATRYPGLPVVGGMASGGHGPGQNLLFANDGPREAGAVGVLIEGGVQLRSVVSQGCRPIGEPWVVTAAESNVIRKLGGRPATEVLIETLEGLESMDAQLFRRAPFVGLAIDASKSQFERGDFLVRGLVGMDPKAKVIAVTDRPRPGQTIQFLVRDAGSAGEDLTHLMRTQGGGALDGAPAHSAGALLFSCNGRGSNMFPVPDHDIGCVRAGLAADVPVAGFFAAGEIGPVGGRNFLHGFTASVAVFRPVE